MHEIDSALLEIAHVRFIVRRAPETIRADQELRPVHPRVDTVHPGKADTPDGNNRQKNRILETGHDNRAFVHLTTMLVPRTYRSSTELSVYLTRQRGEENSTCENSPSKPSGADTIV